MNDAFTVIIPTYNMAGFLPALWASLARSGVTEIATEVLFVNDGSTDDTKAALERLASSGDAAAQKLRLVDLTDNVGRFRARLEGARRARTPRILFLDTRLTLPDDFGRSLARVASLHESIVGSIDIDVDRSVFCLYWERSHRFIFRRHYAAAVRDIVLTPSNYDQYLKGTGVFLCSTKLFVDTCDQFASADVLSDDTLVMRRMVDTIPIVVTPDVRVGWVPRENGWEFLARLWERGPGFVEYHVFTRRGPLFYATMLGLACFVALGVLLALRPLLGIALFAAGVLGIALSTILFARSPSEFVKLLPLHVSVVFAFGAGALRGLAVNIFRALRGRLPPSPPSQRPPA